MVDTLQASARFVHSRPVESLLTVGQCMFHIMQACAWLILCAGFTDCRPVYGSHTVIQCMVHTL